MIRSARRPVVYPQAAHARLAGQIAAAWGNDMFERPPLPFASFVRGVALHDRGYGELDADGLGEALPERWVEIQRRGFEPRGEDPVVDLVVALHVHRLVSMQRNAVEEAALPELRAALPGLHAAAGVPEPAAQTANAITHLCDRVALALCFEEPAAWTHEIAPRAGSEAVELSVTLDGEGAALLDPWPLCLEKLPTLIGGFRADGYPERLDPVIALVELRPA